MEGKRALIDDTFWICPLYAFKCNIEGSERIDLGEGIAIWRISDDLQYYIDERIPELALRANKVEWAIQLPHDIRTRATAETVMDNIHEDIPLFPFVRHPSEITIDLITALRLQHKGEVAPGPLQELSISNGEFMLGGMTFGFPLSKSGDYYISVEEEYQLLEGEVDSLREFWQDFQNSRRKGKLRDLKIALRRFNSSYGEPFEDRLLDHMIAFESLYLEDKQELSYKLALRAAFLLGRKKKERKAIYETLRKAYETRSTIVHGREHRVKEKDRKELQELVADTEEYLRYSIKRFIKLSDLRTLKQLRERLLDDNIIQAGQLLKTK